MPTERPEFQSSVPAFAEAVDLNSRLIEFFTILYGSVEAAEHRSQTQHQRVEMLIIEEFSARDPNRAHQLFDGMVEFYTEFVSGGQRESIESLRYIPKNLPS